MVDQNFVCAPDHDITLDELEDGALLALTRQGNTDAYAVLFERYGYSARRLARHLGQREESEDVVSDAFAQILSLLQRGKGPDQAFRAYLFTAVRHECGRRAKAVKRVTPTDDETVIDSSVPFGDGNLDDFEKTAVRAAYESLPDRWRTVLWHLDVEGRKPHELAEVMGLKPNSVSALVYRARAGLRDAYLQQHVSSSDDTGGRTCRTVRDSLAGVVRRTAPRRDQEKVHAHLASCESCMAVYLDLKEVNRDVGSIVAPVALTVAASGGAGALAVAASSGTVVAQVAGAFKAVLAVAAVPATAAAVAGVAVVSVSAPLSAPTAETPSRAPLVEAAPLTAVPASAPAVRPLDAARPTVRMPVETAGSSVRTAVVGLPKPAPSEAAAPSTPAALSATSGVGLDLGVAKVEARPDAVNVSVGPVKVSTKIVTDIVEEVAPRTTSGLRKVLDLPRE